MTQPALRRPTWRRVGLTGLALWVATVAVTVGTANTNLIPTVVLLGSFLVPVTFVVWAGQHTDTGELTPALLFSTFVVGGVIGVLGASVLESFLLRPSWWLFLGVGVIEETVKLLALAFVTRRLAHKSVRDGMILGASVGFGFAAFESAGYALTALFTTEGLSLAALVKTELLRGLLAPVGHGLWTAILGGVLFRASSRHRFTVTGRLLAALVGVSLLHGLWDAMHSIAVRGTLVLTGGERYTPTAEGWLVRPSAEQAALMPVLEWAGLALIALVGVGWLIIEWRSARRDAPPRLSWHVPLRGAAG
ncbi:PrsW family intramembrane metalloprotease [Cryptosporangium japonicum]|uniref:RsiW-degrading membrane proteinase PrsW (M82 family) n=1 Tax=Cryptosporangium japonicum TaxID=80872 RepID=A0ABP3DLZ5_9ACTN